MGPKSLILKQVIESKGLRYVGGRGLPQAPVYLLGEAPGADEDRLGMPFMGAGGRLQDNMLADAGFAVQDVYFTNPYKTRPPDNDVKRIQELGIPEHFYVEALIEELREAKPTIIIAAGATALRILCPATGGEITNYRGSLLHSDLLDWPHYVTGVRHPAYVLRDWPERPVSVLCYNRAWKELEYYRRHGVLQALPARSIRTGPAYGEVYEWLFEDRSKKTRLSIDIETLRRRVVYTIAIARSPYEAISFCLWDYTEAQTVTIFRLLYDILQSNRQIGQNYLTFDLHWLETLGFLANPGLCDDTLLRHHVLWPELEHSLQFMTLQYTREPFYKNDGKRWTPKESKHKLMAYNGKDAAVTYEVFLEQEKEFNELL